MTPLEFLYYVGYSLKKKRCMARQKRLPFRVISIGNITVGGTGKTPAVIALAEQAKMRGLRPVILTRGYRGKAKGPCFIGTGQNVWLDNGRESIACSLPPDPALCGDEPLVMAERLPDVPIVKCADRHMGGLFALKFLHPLEEDPVIFILDDGFQHWMLYRDTEIVLVDGLNPFGNRRMLPLGPLREPLSELQRAGIVVITKYHNRQLAEELKVLHPEAPVYFSEFRIIGVKDRNRERRPMELLKNKRVFAFCGIANPGSFQQSVSSLGAEIVSFHTFGDHHQYTPGELSTLEGKSQKLSADYMITTEKDMVKIRGFNVPETVLCLEITFHVDKPFFDQVFSFHDAKSI